MMINLFVKTCSGIVQIWVRYQDFSFTNHNALSVSQFVSRTVSYIMDSLRFISTQESIDLGFICKVIHSWRLSITHSASFVNLLQNWSYVLDCTIQQQK